MSKYPDTIIRLKSFGRYGYLVIKYILIFIVIVGLVRFFIIAPGRVNGRSMEPSFVDEQFFLIDKVTYWWRMPKRFEVVQITDSKDSEYLIKRVIGIPGDTLIIWRGRVYLEQGSERFPLDESAYLPSSLQTLMPDTSTEEQSYTTTLGKEQFFVLGDNRIHSSNDSRTFGPILRSQIIGRVIGL